MMKQMTKEMMERCCGEDGTPDFEKMKGFMEKCGKKEFSDRDIEMIRQFCGRSGQPNPQEMKQLMESCGC